MKINDVRLYGMINRTKVVCELALVYVVWTSFYIGSGIIEERELRKKDFDIHEAKK